MIFEDLKYYIWCLESELNPKYCSSITAYKDYVKNSEKHYGDCVLANNSCSRCHLQNIEIKAQNILDCIEEDYEFIQKSKDGL